MVVPGFFKRWKDRLLLSALSVRLLLLVQLGLLGSRFAGKRLIPVELAIRHPSRSLTEGYRKVWRIIFRRSSVRVKPRPRQRATAPASPASAEHYARCVRPLP